MRAAARYVMAMGYLERMEAEAAAVDWVVRSHPWPPFVVGYEAVYGDDHDGDPACWITFKTVANEWVRADRVAALTELTDAIQPKLMDLLRPRLPYFRIATDMSQGSPLAS